MSSEIGRKFLIKNLPDLSEYKPIKFERYYIYKDQNVELRIQKNGTIFEIERKEILNNLTAKKFTMVISQAEFTRLKTLGSEVILRDVYQINTNPDTCINIYHGELEGLKRVDVEFKTEADALTFIIPDWFGKEITDSIISRDSKLLDLSNEKLKIFLQKNS